MPSLFNYLLQVSFLSGIFYLIYYLGFRKQPFFQFNRIYLLVVLLLSWIIPFINFSVPADTISFLNQSPSDFAINPEGLKQFPNQIVENAPSGDNNINQSYPWWLLYWAISIAFLVRSILVIGSIIRLIKNRKSYSINGYKIIEGKDLPDFSFFKWIFININQPQDSRKMILMHEMAHARQRHSADLLILDIIQSILWFNPIIPLFKNSLKECHEFLADQEVLEKGIDVISYARSITTYYKNYNSSLLSYFRGATLKKRIQMAGYKKSRLAGLRYILVLPLFVSCMGLFSFIDDPYSINLHLSDLNSRDSNEYMYKFGIEPLETENQFRDRYTQICENEHPVGYSTEARIIHEELSGNRIIRHMIFVGIRSDSVIDPRFADFKLVQDSAYLLLNKKIPKFSHEDIAGNMFSSDKLKRKPSILCFWGPQIPWSMRNLEILQDLSEEIGDDVNFVGFTYWLDQLPAELDVNLKHFTHLTDAEEIYENLLNVDAIPKIFLLDTKGIIRNIMYGIPRVKDPVLNEYSEDVSILESLVKNLY